MGQKGKVGKVSWTCALCGGECFGTRFGLCNNCLKEWSLSGTYRECTLTGTFHLPEWIRIFAKEHHRDEQKKYNREIPFAHAFPDGEYDGIYIEFRYGFIEEKYHKIERRGRPRKLLGPKENPPGEVLAGRNHGEGG